MKALIKYGHQHLDNHMVYCQGSDCNEFIGQGSVYSCFMYVVTRNDDGISPVVKVKGDRTNESVLSLAAMRKHHRGFSLFNAMEEISHKVEIAKKLGKSYHDTTKEDKVNQISKKTYIMKTFAIKRILVPTDFSETGLLALEHAAYMAKLCKAHLYLLHVVESFEYAYSEYEPEVMVKDLEGVQHVATEKLEKAAARLETQYGIQVSTLLNNGKPSTGIAESVKDNDIDIIVMGTHGAKGFEEFIIGSNAHKVVNISSCPVITIQASARDIQFTNIVMPIDNSLHSRQKVNYVIELASHYGAKIHMLGLLDSNEEMNEADEKKFNIKLDAAENVLKKSGLSYTRKLVKGHNIAIEAMKYSEEVGADLLVIMTDHESSLSGIFMGPLAKQIVNHSKVPVMSIKPIETPISGVNIEAVSLV
jgi:nucleotide-binding universal stress UspA family protein